MATVIVSGALANKYLNGGAAWTRLSYVLGLKKLGLEVYFLEQINRKDCVDARGAVAAFDSCANLAYFKQITADFGLSGCSYLIYENGDQVYGPGYADLLELADSADLLINLSGHLKLHDLKRRVRRRVYIDQDPGFTHFWHMSGCVDPSLEGHDFYFTIGENIGTLACSIPTDPIRWRRTRQPIVLEYWPLAGQYSGDLFATIASWRGPFGPVHYGDRTYGLKVHEFRKFIHLPERTQQTFEIALDIHPSDAKDLKVLRQHGWRIVDPRVVVPDPVAFRRYVQSAGAEFSVAQGVYVETGSGWFSDRTVRFLASGKPALVQDTGFSRNYPVGEGLLAFQTMEQAVDGANRISRNYAMHCRAARAIAEAYFESNKVLGELLAEVGVA